MLAILDGLERQLFGNATAADQLDNDVDLGVGDHREGIVGQSARSGSDRLCKFEILVGNYRNLDRTSCASGNLLGVALEHRESSATDGADAEESNVDRFHFKAFLKLNEGICIPSRK